MRYSVLAYLIGEGFSNVFKNKKQALTSIGIMCVTMVIFGIFFIIGENLNHFIEEVESKQGLQVYMRTDATEEEIDTLEQQLDDIQEISSIEYVGKEDALQDLRDRFGEDSDLIGEYYMEVLPVSFVITLNNLEDLSRVQEQVRALELVDDVRSSDNTINVLVNIANGIRIGTYVIFACLIAFSVFIILNFRLEINDLLF